MKIKNLKDKSIQIIIFGASGNLAVTRLIPAIYQLAKKDKLPENIVIHGVTRREWDDYKFADEMFKKSKEYDSSFVNLLKQKMVFTGGSFDNADVFESLMMKISNIDKKWGKCSDKIFYLSVPPNSYDDILNNIKVSGLTKICNQAESKLVIEKPFGTNYKSALVLNNKLLEIFRESQIFRIDHVLGKDTLMDILSFRKHNYIFNKLFNREDIDHIQICMLETLGIEDRGNFYEQTGVINDMVQNHLLQMLAITTMRLPYNFTYRYLQTAKTEVIESLSKVNSEELVVGQYEAGEVNGKKVIKYQDEINVAKDSKVPTYVAFKTTLNLPGKEGIPVYFRTGKRLQNKYYEVDIVFKKINKDSNLKPNILTFRIQPYEGVSLCLVKDKSFDNDEMENISLDFCYKVNGSLPDAYENLLYQVLLGDKTYFVGIEEVLASWKFIDPLNEMLRAHKLSNYKSGTWGPKESYDLIEKDGRYWLTEHLEMICRV